MIVVNSKMKRKKKRKEKQLSIKKLKEGMYIDWEKPNLNKQKSMCLLLYQPNQFFEFVFLFIFEFITIV